MGDVKSEEDRHNWFSVAFFSYMNPLLSLGFKKQLNSADLPQLCSADQCKACVHLLDERWRYELSIKHVSTSLYRPLYAAFGRPFLMCALWKMPQDAFQFLQPVIFRKLLEELKKDRSQYDLSTCLFFVAVMFIVQLLQSICLARYFHGVFRSSVHVKSALQAIVFRKTLTLSAESKQHTSAALTLMNSDTSKVSDLLPYFHNMLWSSPLQIIVSLAMLVYYLDWSSALAGLFVMALLIPINAYLTDRVKVTQNKLMKAKTNRTSAIAETVNGIRVLKYFTWENLMRQRVQRLREDEVSAMRLSNIISAVASMFMGAAPGLVAVAVLGVFSLNGGELTLENVFPSLSVMNIMRFAMFMLPNQVASFIQAKESLNRLRDFLKLPDLQVNIASAATKRTESSFSKRGATLEAPPEVRIKNGYFSWGSNSTGGTDATLRAINAVFPAGKLTAIVGKVGCGKSSMLSALLGEMIMSNGSVQLGCAVALASQEPWIQNATVRDNILFGCPLDTSRYAEVIRVCALQSDLDILPAGDMTEIGEKGINLSGGQKQRINVARAVYCGADVYMFDDPLSAVDSHVGAHMFSACFLHYLSGTTRLLVTHKIEVLHQVDHIICMTDEGSIRCSGSFAEISSKHPEILNHILASETSQAHHDTAATTAAPPNDLKPKLARDPCKSASGSLTSVENRAQGAVSAEVYKFYAAAMGRNYLIAVFLAGALSQVI
jgi:ATP-binding cassette subfamily C (CFTR/MRP) protein 1